MNELTACSQSNLRLVAQARKYELGLLSVTQVPKALAEIGALRGRIGSIILICGSKNKRGHVPDEAFDLRFADVLVVGAGPVRQCPADVATPHPASRT